MKVAALAVLFGLIGTALGDGEGFVPGLMFGALVGMVLGARTRLTKLEREQSAASTELQELREQLRQLRSRAELPVAATAPVASAVPIAPAETPSENVSTATAFERASAPPELASSPAFEPTAPPETPTGDLGGMSTGPVRIDIPSQSAAPQEPAPGTAPADQAAPDVPHWESAAWPADAPARVPAGRDDAGLPFDRLEAWVRELLFGGNTIVRVGILVLLVGVVLLLRWAAEHSVFPIELRMAAAGLLCSALIAVGYRQRHARPGFGRTLQGGGVAGLYLVVFFSYRTYELLPSGMAFGLLACIALSSGVLAVVQDALALLVIGQIGGFMAPVLASSGGGSHVALFSYYLLLNLLVFAVAWFKPWRALNLIGFAFTFGIGSTWGALRYRPEDFASTEPFLIAFFLLYSLIPVLYALRRREHQQSMGGWVDGSLVFGTPLAVLILQAAMVGDMRFGMAYSALGLGAFYVGLSRLLVRYAPEALRALIESFLAIGIGFATLAVPYGFDNHDFTGATWSLEGAGLYWVGTRQKRWLSRLAGASLQLFAAGALLVQLDRGVPDATWADWPLANARFLASALVCLGCLFVACRAYRQRAELPEFEAPGLQLLIALGLALYLHAALGEVRTHAPSALRPGLLSAVTFASVFALSLAARRLAWLPGRFPAVLLALLLPLFLLAWEAKYAIHPLGRGGWLAYPIAFALHTELLRRFVPEAPKSRVLLHMVYLWSALLLLELEAAHRVHDAGLNQTWSASAVALLLAFGLIACVRGVRAQRWPFREAPDAYLQIGAGVVALAGVLWSLWANFSLTGDAAPLPSWPLLHPLDIAQLTLFASAFSWYLAIAELETEASVLRAIPAILGALLFVWFNALLARSVHHFAGVAFDADALWDATPMQVSLSIAWSVLGLVGTALGSVKQLRWLWIVGASLLGVVVAKLFLIDLAQLSTIAKIGTFLVVGLLLVLVGYFAPVPPPVRAADGEERGV